MANNPSYGWMTGQQNAQPDPTSPGQYGGNGSNIWGGMGANNGVGSAINSGYYSSNPSAGYSSWLGYGGLGGNSDTSQYARSQYSRQYNNYLGALPYMPAGNNQFLDYLNQSGYNPANEFQSLGARSRGEMPFLADPRTRFMAPS